MNGLVAFQMQRDKILRSMVLLIVDAFSNFAVNVVVFNLIALITSLSYAVR